MPPLLKLRSTGRGRKYSPWRGLIESTLSFAYLFDWPHRVWGLVPGATDVNLLRFELPILPPGAASPLRLAFVSDVHIGPTTPPRTIDNAFRLLADLSPDVLVLGGDYVYLEATRAAAARLETLVASVPARVKLAVLGNHDLWARHSILEEALARGGARVLVNEAVHLPAPHSDVAVLGIDDPWTGEPDAGKAFGDCNGAHVKLAVCHAPEGLPLVRGRGAALLLCGHTHGGQMALPRGPVVVHGPYGRRWPSGLHQVDDLHLFVSRGLGGAELPIRTWAPPDVSLFTLTAGVPVA